ncbi:MAG: hypothetical protein ABJH28_12505 [Paraglaciecola sp.]|uniref:hypothetical protein n=1 Tax=Paraglaciecola sp. TaxID=1920173 RepID=UPI0032642779
MTATTLDTSITVRLSTELKLHLQSEASILNMSLGEYVRFLLLSETAQRKEIRKIKRNVNTTQLAQIQQLLSRQNIANNLNQISRNLHTGTTVPFCPDTKAQMFEANHAMQAIRRILMNEESHTS